MNAIKWKSLTDEHKNICVAELVVGWQRQWHPDGWPDSWLVPNQKNPVLKVPDYLHSADAVLPLLDFTVAIGQVANGDWRVDLDSNVDSGGQEFHSFAIAESFCEAVMVAVLRAKGIEVITE
jgi:hypothetical protein